VISASRDGCIKLTSLHNGTTQGVLAAPQRMVGQGGEAAGTDLPRVGGVYALLVFENVLFSGGQNKDLGALNAW
jgi:hypothetical protein